MSTSVQQNPQGPLWPLGNIAVATPGTPVRITSLVDPTAVNAPESATSPTSDEYTRRAQQITFQGFKANTDGLQPNTGNVYIILKGGKGSNNRDDAGSIIWVLQPGQTWTLGSSALNRNVFSLYQFYIDADNAADGAQVSAIIQ